MAEDPYSKWLGIGPGPRPPKPRDLLGLGSGKLTRDAIEQAADACMDRLDQFVLSSDPSSRAEVQQLMNEVAKARTSLTRKLSNPQPDPVKPSATIPLPTPTDPPPLHPAQAAGASGKTATPWDDIPMPTYKPPAVQRLDDARSPLKPINPPAPRRALSLFWPLLVSSWLLSLVITAIVVYTLASPEPVVPSPYEYAAVLPAVPDPPVPADDPVVDDLPTDPDDQVNKEEAETEPHDNPEPTERDQNLPEIDPAEIQRQQLAEQERKAERAKAQRLAQLKERRDQTIETHIQKYPDQQAYFAKRDALENYRLVDAVRQAMRERNPGVNVRMRVEFKDNQIDLLDLSVTADNDDQANQNAYITDLTAIAGLEISRLDLSGLRRLKSLDDLSGMPLTAIDLTDCVSLKNLDALAYMPLESITLLNCKNLSGKAFERISLENPDARIVSNMTQKQRLEQMTAAELDQFKRDTLKDYIPKRDQLQGPEKINVIRQALSDFNGGIDVNVRPVYEGDQLVGLSLKADPVTVGTKAHGNALISDITPLTGLPLKSLDLSFCRSLTTLRGLEGMPLEKLSIGSCKQLADISAIRGAPIQTLYMGDLKITDLEDLRGMPLKKLQVYGCDGITTTAPLKGIVMDDILFSSCDKLQDISGLESVDASDGTIVLSGLPITDLSPIGGKKIRLLRCQNLDKLSTLVGLKGSEIKILQLEYMHELTDLQALRDVKLTDQLKVEGRKIADLTPLSRQRIRSLHLRCQSLTSLSGIEGISTLETLTLRRVTKIVPQELERFEKARPQVKILSY